MVSGVVFTPRRRRLAAGDRVPRADDGMLGTKAPGLLQERLELYYGYEDNETGRESVG